MSYERCKRCERFFENKHYPRPVQWWEIRVGSVERPLKDEAVIQVQLCEDCVNGVVKCVGEYLGQNMMVNSINNNLSEVQIAEMDERNQKVRVKAMASGVYDMDPNIDPEIANVIEDRDVDEVMEMLGYDPIIRFPNAYNREEIDKRNKNIREREKWHGVYVSPKMDDIPAMIEKMEAEEAA